MKGITVLQNIRLVSDEGMNVTVAFIGSSKVAAVDWNDETIHYYPKVQKFHRDRVAEALGFPTA